VVLELLKEASKDKQFKVFVTESRPDGSGWVELISFSSCFLIVIVEF